MLTLNDIYLHPDQHIQLVELPLGSQGVIRPLHHQDAPALTKFFTTLSPQTQHFYSITPNTAAQEAQAHCDAINKYDKLRFVLETDPDKEIIGILEFSFDLVAADYQRYASYGIQLDGKTDCRYGLCISDRFHGQGIGRQLTRFAQQIALKFDQKRIILLGGVLANNTAARKHYTRNGFAEKGSFTNTDSLECIDMIWNHNNQQTR